MAQAAAVKHVEHCMGTVFTFDIRQPGVDPASLAAAVRLLHELDRDYSTYREDSVISRLDRGEISPAQLAEQHPQVARVLAECESWKARTDGWFDARAGGRLDPSGYVKGWAIEQASQVLVRAGSTSHTINGGGDIACVGSAGDRPWRLGIVDPRDRSQLLATVTGNDLALATSGTAERGRHILNPATGEPVAEQLLSLSVTGDSVIECDVLATAGFAMGEASQDWFSARKIRAFAVRADGTTWSSFELN
ncbi:MAG: FAD:protein FMN transferase [Jatrophihabitantaceae bacterium]